MACCWLSVAKIHIYEAVYAAYQYKQQVGFGIYNGPRTTDNGQYLFIQFKQFSDRIDVK
jgi:hypothetical protein